MSQNRQNDLINEEIGEIGRSPEIDQSGQNQEIDQNEGIGQNQEIDQKIEKLAKITNEK